jgi:hypothetical protein
MDLALVVREPGSYFTGNESVGQVSYFEAAFDDIMVSDGYMCHTSTYSSLVDMLRPCV